jgi:hypothetical protein
VLGTDEPIYPDPSPELLAAAAKLRAEVSPARLRTLVESIPGPRSRLHAPEAMIAADEVIADAWTTAGWQVERQPLHLRGEWGLTDGPGHGRAFKRITRHGELNGVNLMATLRGREADAIVIAAHLDTVYRSPGADDNAAGVVVLMEVARLLGSEGRQRTVILAAPDFEEIGLIGSRELVRLLKTRHRVRAAIVFDPIGYMDARPNTQKLAPGVEFLYPRQLARLRARDNAGDGVVAIHRRRSNALVRVWAQCAAAAIGRERVVMLRDPCDLPIIGPFLNVVPLARNFSRSDHRRFWDARLPAIQVTNTAEFRNPHYHRPSDKPESLDYETLADMVVATVLAARRLAG